MADQPSQPEPTTAPNKTNEPQKAPEETQTPSKETKTETEPTSPPLSKHASHSPLAFANYPPLWSKDKKSTPSPKPQLPAGEEKQAGASIETLKSILSTTSKDERRPNQRFQERDPSNQHQYLQQPDRSVTSHARLNVFGRDIGPMGKAPSLFGGGRKKK